MGITNNLDIDVKISIQMRNGLDISSHTEVDVWKRPSWSSQTGSVDIEWSEDMAREKKVSSKSIKTSKGQAASNSKSNVKNHARGHSKSGGKKNKLGDRRSVEYREMLNRATKFAIDLHREALKDLEKH